jgi:hypothetical protein
MGYIDKAAGMHKGSHASPRGISGAMGQNVAM